MGRKALVDKLDKFQLQTNEAKKAIDAATKDAKLFNYIHHSFKDKVMQVDANIERFRGVHN